MMDAVLRRNREISLMVVWSFHAPVGLGGSGSAGPVTLPYGSSRFVMVLWVLGCPRPLPGWPLHPHLVLRRGATLLTVEGGGAGWNANLM